MIVKKGVIGIVSPGKSQFSRGQIIGLGFSKKLQGFLLFGYRQIMSISALEY